MEDDAPAQFTASPEQWEKLKPLARHMRHAPTPAEDLLWQQLRNRQLDGAKFRRQHAIAGFIVDFVCIEQRLVIEVDGGIHIHTDQQVYDAQRTAVLAERGFRTLRVTNAAVEQSIAAVLTSIRAALATSEPDA
jgi:very-short-patch-repair endonuclease